MVDKPLLRLAEDRRSRLLPAHSRHVTTIAYHARCQRGPWARHIDRPRVTHSSLAPAHDALEARPGDLLLGRPSPSPGFKSNDLSGELLLFDVGLVEDGSPQHPVQSW